MHSRERVSLGAWLTQCGDWQVQNQQGGPADPGQSCRRLRLEPAAIWAQTSLFLWDPRLFP